MHSKNKLLVFLAIVALLIFLIYLSTSFYQILALSLIVAYFVYPVKKKIMKKVKSESFASLLSMIVGFITLSLFIVVFVSSIYSSFRGIASFASEAGNVALINNTINLFESYNIQEPLTEAGLTQIINLLRNLLFLAPQIVISVVVFLFFLYYFIKFGEEIVSNIRGLVPPTEMSLFDKFTKRLNGMMKAIFQGQFITAIVQSIILFGFMVIIGAPYAFELSFFTFVLCFLSITVSIVPIGLNIWYFYQGFLTGDYFMFIVTVVFTFVITTVDNIIKPLIGEKVAEMNPVLFILGLTGGALTLGFTGFIIGPLLVGMFQAAMEILFEEKNIKFI